MESNPPSPLPHLLLPLQAVTRWLSACQVPFVIIGGVAVACIARPRFTADIDAAVAVEDMTSLESLVEAATPFELFPINENASAFARQHRVLRMRHRASGISIDVSMIALPFEHEMIARAHRYTLAGLEIRLPTPEDLVILKAVAHRPQDLIDIASILEAHPELDLERVRSWLKQFAEVLEAPELVEDLEFLVNKARLSEKLRRIFPKPD